MKSNQERVLHIDMKEFLLDLYEIELYKKSLYENRIGTNIPKSQREKEFAIAIKNAKAIEELLDMLDK